MSYNDFTWQQPSTAGELGITVAATWPVSYLAERGEVATSDWQTMGREHIHFVSGEAVYIVLYVLASLDAEGEIRLTSGQVMTDVIPVPPGSMGTISVYWMPGWAYGDSHKTIVMEARKVSGTTFFTYLESSLVAPSIMIPAATSGGYSTYEAMAQ